MHKKTQTHSCAQFHEDAHGPPTKCHPHIQNHKHGLSQLFPLALPPSLPHWVPEESSRPGGWSCWRRRVVPEDFPPPVGQPRLAGEGSGAGVVKRWGGPHWIPNWPPSAPLHCLRQQLEGRSEDLGSYFLSPEPLSWLWLPLACLGLQEELERSHSTRAGREVLSWWVWQVFACSQATSVCQVHFRLG